MYQAKYKNIDKSGFNPEVKVTVVYSNGVNEIENTYDVLPEDLTSDKFKKLVQNQIDILNEKENLQDTDSLLETEIKIDSSPVDTIDPIK